MGHAAPRALKQEALAEAINAYEGGLVLVSHDFRLIGQVNPAPPPHTGTTLDPSPALCLALLCF
jgi:hypothetical protein